MILSGLVYVFFSVTVYKVDKCMILTVQILKDVVYASVYFCTIRDKVIPINLAIRSRGS